MSGVSWWALGAVRAFVTSWQRAVGEEGLRAALFQETHCLFYRFSLSQKSDNFSLTCC
jgi:hypothetical protein